MAIPQVHFVGQYSACALQVSCSEKYLVAIGGRQLAM